MSVTRKLLGCVAALCLALPVFANTAEENSAALNAPAANPQQLASAQESTTTATTESASTAANTAITKAVNINTADAKELSSVKGLNNHKAQAIVAYREQHGPFKSVEDLTAVKGISKKFIERNRSMLTVG